MTIRTPSLRLAVALSATAAIAVAPAVAASTASATSTPVAHAAKHHTKKHKKHKKHHPHHHSTPTRTPTATTPAPTTAQQPAPSPAQAPASSPTPTPAAPTIPLGSYNCYQTDEVIGIGGGFYSHFAREIDLNANGTYAIPFAGGYTGDNHWSQQANTIDFTSGPLWNDLGKVHDQGIWYPDGVSMPNAASNVRSGGYTLVIRDTVQEGGVPPSVEYSTTDRPGGGSTAPMSFQYCKLPG